MGWLAKTRHKAAADTSEWPVTDHAPEPVPSLAGTPYRGDKNVAFRDGFYYVCPYDADGNELGPDTSTPLVWRDGGLHYARPDDPNHFHSYGLNALDLEPGSED